MIIKYTFNDNDFTQIIEKYLDEYESGPFIPVLFTNIKSNIQFKKDVSIYTELSKNSNKREKLKEKLLKVIEQEFTDYINSIRENSNWNTVGFTVKDLINSKKYILDNIKVDIVDKVEDKWQNDEVVYYFPSNMKYITM